MNLKQQSFVTEYLRTGDKIIAYRTVYQPDSTNYRSLESAANRLLQNTEVTTTIRHVQDKIRYEVEQELKAEMKRELLTVQRKRELLYQIAMGELAVEQHYRGKNCSQCTQYVKPTINQMLKAIDLDSKLAGHYAVKEKTFTAPQPTRHAELDSASRETQKEIPQQNTTKISHPFRGIGGKTTQQCHPEPDSGYRETPISLEMRKQVKHNKKEKPDIPQQNTTNPVPSRLPVCSPAGAIT